VLASAVIATKRKPVVETTPIYAHRLGSAYGPESSRAALEGSVRRQVDGLEADLVLSADDDVLVLHDPYLPVSTNLDGWAQDRSAVSLVRDGRLRDSRGDPSDQRPMVLAELLEATEGLPLYLDLKSYTDPELARRLAHRTCELIEHYRVSDRAEVVSFFSAACAAAIERGLPAHLAVWADYAPEALARWAREHHLAGVSFEAFIFTRPLRDALRGAGLRISVGAINSIEQLEPVLPMAPDVLVSDRPHELREEWRELSASR
jgi:glycerophosphoryl diester phosphodiesterase